MSATTRRVQINKAVVIPSGTAAGCYTFEASKSSRQAMTSRVYGVSMVAAQAGTSIQLFAGAAEATSPPTCDPADAISPVISLAVLRGQTGFQLVGNPITGLPVQKNAAYQVTGGTTTARMFILTN